MSAPIELGETWPWSVGGVVDAEGLFNDILKGDIEEEEEEEEEEGRKKWRKGKKQKEEERREKGKQRYD